MKDPRTRSLLRFFVRVLVIWAIQVVGLLVMEWLLPGVSVDSLETAIVAAAVIGLVNALLWPILSYLILPFAVLTLGLLSLVLNAVLLLLASALVAGFTVNNLGSAILLALGLAAINTILSSLLTIDDDNSWSRNMVRRRMKRLGEVVETDVPGVLFLEIDGLSEPVLEKAIREGYVPTMARWLETGGHRLVGWETDLSSQTSASQAGILLGDNYDIPAFRWYEKEHGKQMVSNFPADTAEIERRLAFIVLQGHISHQRTSRVMAASVWGSKNRIISGSRSKRTVAPMGWSVPRSLRIWKIVPSTLRCSTVYAPCSSVAKTSPVSESRTTGRGR